MSVHVVLLVLLLVGLAYAFRLEGRAARRARRLYGLGFLLSLGGCVGALGWLGAETSGRKNLFHEVSPAVWTAVFVVGILVLVVTSVLAITARPGVPNDRGQPEERP